MIGEATGRRQRSLHCNPEEQAMIRARAEAAGKPVSRYVLDLALADDAGRGGSGPGPVMDQRQQRLRIPRLEEQPVLMVPLAEGIEEIVVPDLRGLETVRRGVVLQVSGQGLEDQADGGEALLAVIDKIG